MPIDYASRIRKVYPQLVRSCFWRAEGDSANLPTSTLLEWVYKDFPELKGSRCRRMKRSNDYVVLLLEDKWIFRFTRGNELEDIEELLREQAVLDCLRDRIRVPVPDFQFRPDSLDYAGYAAISGTLLSPWRFRRLARPNKRAAALDLSNFLGAIHAFPVSQAADLGVGQDDRDWLSRGEEQFDRSAGGLDPELRHTCERWLAEFRRETHEPSFAFIHNDIYPYHLIHDPDEGRLTGIIDWADQAIADRAKDFSGLWFCGEDFVDAVLSAYPHPDPTLKKRSLSLIKLITICSYDGGKTDPLWAAALRRFSTY